MAALIACSHARLRNNRFPSAGAATVSGAALFLVRTLFYHGLLDKQDCLSH